MKNLSGRVAVITGAGNGIGAALARRLAAAGMKIVASDIDPAAARAMRDELSAHGHQAAAIATDVGDAAAVDALAEFAWATYGGAHLVCANAGIVPGGRHRAVWEYPLEDWRWSLDVNLMGVVHAIRSFIPRMLAGGDEGHFLATASVAGLVSSSGSVVYGAAKHAVVRVTEGLYAGLRERQAPIGVTLLCPGLVNTRIYDSERCRPDHLRPAAGPATETPELQAIASQLYSGALSPEAVAEQAQQAIENDDLYVLTTAAFDVAIRDRLECVLDRRNPAFASLLEMSKRDVHLQGQDS